MKKSIFFLSIFLFALTLSACSNEAQDPILDETGDVQDHQEDNGTSEEEHDEEEVLDTEELSGEQLEEEDGVDETGVNIQSWRLYSQELKQVEIRYPQNWYYRRDLTEELENDYYLFAEFADGPQVFEGLATSTIQLIGISRDKDLDTQEYHQVAGENEEKDLKFFLRTNDSEYQEIVDTMAPTFEFFN